MIMCVCVCVCVCVVKPRSFCNKELPKKLRYWTKNLLNLQKRTISLYKGQSLSIKAMRLLFESRIMCMSP